MYYITFKLTDDKKIYRAKVKYIERVKDILYIETINNKHYEINWSKIDFYTKVYYEV